MVLLCWFLAELALHAYEPRYLEKFDLDDMNYIHVYSEDYGWLPRRGFRQRGRPETTINDSGYRGPAYRHARTPGTPRIVMMGDSLAFGYGVADDETSSRQMERVGAPLEVVNLAVQGYGTDQALLRFEREGVLYHPDVVILNFCLANDFRDNGATRAIYDGAYPKPYFTLDSGLVLHAEHLRLSHLSRLGLFLHQRSIVFNTLRRMTSGSPTQLSADAMSAEHPPAPEVTVALLQRFAAVARANEIRFVVAVYPNLREFQGPSRRPQVLLGASGLEDALRVDLRPRLEARGINRETFWDYSLDGNFHANARGQLVVAKVLVEALRQAGLLPKQRDTEATQNERS